LRGGERMSPAVEILADVLAAGFEVRADGDLLLFRSHGIPLSDETCDLLASHKPEILAMITEPTWPAPPTLRCRTCSQDEYWFGGVVTEFGAFGT
jgi:hypothetical protein